LGGVLATGALAEFTGIAGEATIATAALAGPWALVPAVVFAIGFYATLKVGDLTLQAARKPCNQIRLSFP
jgi:hypothetical protein